MSIDAIIDDFSFLDSWDDRYRYIIELGRDLPPFPDEDRTEANRVRGCASQVWLTHAVERPGDGGAPVLHYRGDSDAQIVKGLVAIALALFDGKTPEDVAATDAHATFERIDLASHLTAQRANGLRALVERIKAVAAEAARA